jgi:hypothetical protein
LLLSIEKPYLKSKLEKCDSKSDFDIMMKFIDEDEEKAKWEADNNSTGSILNIAGTIPKNKASKPLTVDEILAQKKLQRMEELKEIRNRRR